MGVTTGDKPYNMGMKTGDGDEKYVSLLQDWLEKRNGTIKLVSGLAEELDNFHKNATYAKITGASAGVVGGLLTIAAMTSVFTGGASLGLGLVMVGGLGMTAVDVMEYWREQANVKGAQQALTVDKEALAKLLSEIEVEDVVESDESDETISNFEPGRAMNELWTRVGGIAKTANKAVNGAKSVGTAVRRIQFVRRMAVVAKNAKTGKTAVGIVTRTRTVQAMAKFGAAQTLRSLAGVTTIAFTAFDLASVIAHAVELENGDTTNAAKEIRKICRQLVEQRDQIVGALNMLTTE